MTKYKKHYDKLNGDWCILEKKMIFIGKLTWCLHSIYKNPQDRNKKLEELLREI